MTDVARPRPRSISNRAEDVSELDKRIIEHLQADGRRPYTQIAAFSLVILALAAMPNGLFGVAAVKKV